jgi:hypothetical protein
MFLAIRPGKVLWCDRLHASIGKTTNAVLERKALLLQLQHLNGGVDEHTAFGAARYSQDVFIR